MGFVAIILVVVGLVLQWRGVAVGEVQNIILSGLVFAVLAGHYSLLSLLRKK